MQYCPKCRVKIRGNKSCCPLCRASLTGEGEDGAFPVLQKRISNVSLFKILTFIAAAVIIGMLTVLYITDMRWTIAVIILAVIGWIDVLAAFYYRHNLLMLIHVETYAGMLICLFIDRSLKFTGWSVRWIMPFAVIAVFVAAIMIAAFSKIRIEDCIIYLLFDTLAAFLQLIGVANGVNTFPYPTVICAAGIAIGMLAIIIFRFRDFKSASGKWFNI